MKTWFKNLTVLSFVLAVTVASGVCNAQAAGFGHGHRSDVDMKLVASLGLSSEEQANLTNALSTYGPAVRTAMKTFRAAYKQMKADIEATSPEGSQLAADAAALAVAKAQLKTTRAQLDSALSAALTPEHLQQLQAALTAQFQSRLDKRTDRLLFGYALYLKKQ